MRTRMRASLAETLPVNDESVVERLRRSIAEAGLDCNCREAANDMLDTACLEEDLLRRAAGLIDARKMRDAIVLVVALLGELEIAGLFNDVGDFAAYGAEAARRAAGQGNA
jgi:hypothetical protein